MKFIVFLISFLLFISSQLLCGYTAERVYDEANKGEYHKVKGNNLDVSRLIYDGIKSIELNPARYLTQNKDIFYFFILEIKGTSWILIEDRKSLIIDLDGVEYSYNVYQKPKRQQYPRYFLETVWYQLPDNLPRLMAHAKNIKITLNSKYGKINFKFQKENYNVIDFFYKTFILTPQEKKELENKQKYNVSE